MTGIHLLRSNRAVERPTGPVGTHCGAPFKHIRPAPPTKYHHNARSEASPFQQHPSFASVGPPATPVAIGRRAVSCKAAAAAAAASPPPSPLPSLLRFLDANFIPVALISATALGWLFPGPGVAAAAVNLQTYTTIGIFIISGILLERGEAVATLRSPLALLYGVAAILFFTPVAALGVLRLPLAPPEIALGLAVFCCVPTTLSTCVTLSGACRGNAAVALLLVIVTNVIGVFTLPPVLAAVVARGAAASLAFDPAVLFFNLVKTVLLPLLAGAALQTAVPAVAAWRRTNRKFLSYLSTFFLCMVPFMQLSMARRSGLALGPAALAQAAAAAIGLHLVFLAVNTAATGAIRFNADPEQNWAIRKALILATSQKTLPVAVAVLSQLAAASGLAAGPAVVPCVMAHILQIAIDSAVVARWNAADAAAAKSA